MTGPIHPVLRAWVDSIQARTDLGPVFALCVEVAVPLWRERRRGWSASELEARARELVEPLCSGADIVVDAARAADAKRGQVARGFNEIAEALAICDLLAPA